ncbi:MAG: MBL fold metallo-hydrolase [Bacteroidota bacterium]|nr:MBL fold metallo-hydrolase [Bacteroidota bacterium]
MRRLAFLATLVMGWPAHPAMAQQMDPTIRPELIQQVTEHVHYIPDENRPLVPNVGFVVGSKAVLIIDTGLGQENGAIVLEAARGLSDTERFYVVASHTHPEHDLGAMAFPDDAAVIRSGHQEEDIEELGMSLADRFAEFSPRTAELLEDAAVRPSDIVFEDSLVVDLGGVTVHLINIGPAHTRGDLAIYVEPDNVLFTGDVVMNQYPMPLAPNGSVQAWLNTLDRIEALDPAWVIPCHYDTGGVELIQNYRRFFATMHSRAVELRHAGSDDSTIADTLTEETIPMFADWSDNGRIGASIALVLRSMAVQ